MKKTKNPIFFRYEFSNESGRPEGGDIFQFGTLNEVQDMVAEIVKVAHSDNVTVNLTIGEKKPFYGFLKKAGMSKQDIENEMVDLEVITVDTPEKAPKAKKASKKAKSKKKSKK